MEYFTPTIEDIYSGYEYEVKRFNGDWEKVTEFSNDYDYEDNPHYAIMKDIEAGKIRVLYLTKEQIESEGWKFIKIHEMIDPLKEFRKKDYLMTYSKGKKLLTISHVKLGVGEFLFCGTCKSINDLRYIQKLLNIE